MMQQTRFTQTNRVHWAPRGFPSQKYLPTCSFFLFDNTRLLCFNCVRCFLFPIPPASLENIWPPRGFFCFITHGCYLRTVCDALSSKFSIAPAFHSRIVKFSVPASFPQTQPPAPSPPHTHTPKPP